MTLTHDEYFRAIDLCERAVTAARSDDGGPTVAGTFLGQLATLLAEPVDEKSRGEAYMRGHRDGRLAERAEHRCPAAALESRGIMPELEDDECECSPRADGLHSQRCPTDVPPFAPELADAPLPTGESGAPAPFVVDQPVHDSTLPAELDQQDGHRP